MISVVRLVEAIIKERPMASLYNHFETDFGGIQNSVALLNRKKILNIPLLLKMAKFLDVNGSIFDLNHFNCFSKGN